MCGIILAGGASRRMGGSAKALLPIGGCTLIGRVAQVLRRVFPDVILITNTPEAYAFLELPMFSDIVHGCGSLGGLFTGLTVCNHSYGFFVACDMPFLNTGVMRKMAGLAPGYDVVVPHVRGWLEPLHAIYSRSCLPHAERLIESGDLKIVHLFPKVHVREVGEEALRVFDPEFRFLLNLNTPEDLRQAEGLLSE